MPHFRLGIAVMLLAVSLIWFGLGPRPAFAEDIVWEGNGTSDGICNNIGEFDDLEPGPGEQGWLFILTSPDNAAWELTATFDPDGVTDPPITGDQQGEGNGSVHFIVYTSIGATLESAIATGGSLNSVLTVSHCETGTGDPVLLIHKECEGGAGQFGFSLDPAGDPPGDYLVNCGGTSDPITLEPGTEYTLTEGAPPSDAWTLTGFDCNIDFEETESGVVFMAPADTLIVCTFVNTFDPGESPADPTVVIHKVCEGGTNGEFSFALDPNGDPDGPHFVDCAGSSDPITLEPNEEYTLTENDGTADAWTLVDFDCNLAFDEAEDGVTFTAPPGTEIECTAVNELTNGVVILQSLPGRTSPSAPAVSSSGGGGGGGSPAGAPAAVATESPVAEVQEVRSLPATGTGGPVSGGSSPAWLLIAATLAACLAGIIARSLRRHQRIP